jgi:hypothetical protein
MTATLPKSKGEAADVGMKKKSLEQPSRMKKLWQTSWLLDAGGGIFCVVFLSPDPLAYTPPPSRYHPTHVNSTTRE